MAENTDPVGPQEAAHFFEPLLHCPCVVAAVSGGPDSLALLHLLAEWRDGLGSAAPQIVAATIDHCLRESSAAEALFVAQAAAALRIPHQIERWRGGKPAQGIPEAARAARYGLLRRVAENLAPESFSAVVTGHTLDDAAETFLMRLKRGAGVEGLAEMSRLRNIDPADDCFVVLVRPLLGVPKSRLMATLRARGVAWIDDPTNTNHDFERPRLRRVLALLKEEGLQAGAIAASAQRLRKAHDALSYADDFFRDQVSLRIDQEIFAELDAATFALGPRLLRERLLARLIQRFGGTTPEPQLSEVEDLVLRLEGEGEMRLTLGGAYISKGTQALRVWREVGRIPAGDLILNDGVNDGLPQLWDNRFWVSVDGVSGPVHVRALGLDRLAQLDLQLPVVKRAPSRAVAALPAFYLGQDLIGVPALAYHAGTGFKLEAWPALAD